MWKPYSKSLVQVHDTLSIHLGSEAMLRPKLVLNGNVNLKVQ
jgi:hypothetical protein